MELFQIVFTFTTSKKLFIIQDLFGSFLLLLAHLLPVSITAILKYPQRCLIIYLLTIRHFVYTSLWPLKLLISFSYLLDFFSLLNFFYLLNLSSLLNLSFLLNLSSQFVFSTSLLNLTLLVLTCLLNFSSLHNLSSLLNLFFQFLFSS